MKKCQNWSNLYYTGVLKLAVGQEQALKVSLELPEQVSQPWLGQSPGMGDTWGGDLALPSPPVPQLQRHSCVSLLPTAAALLP